MWLFCGGRVTRMISDANQKAIEDAGLLSSSAPASLTSRTRSLSGGANIPARTFLTGRSSPSPGPPPGHKKPPAAGTRPSTTSTAPTAAAAPCEESMSRSPRPRKPSPGSSRSSGTGSSPSPKARTQSTGHWRPRPARWPGSRATPPTWRPARTAPRSPPSS